MESGLALGPIELSGLLPEEAVDFGFTRAEIGVALEKVLATAQFEIEGKDLALADLDDFRRSTADFSTSRSNWCCSGTFCPTLIFMYFCMFGTPSRYRMRSMISWACFISSMDSA